MIILGGGTGGSAVANKFAKRLGQGSVAVLEPQKVHYYQPMWTLVGAGLKNFENSKGTTRSVLPGSCDWIQEAVTDIDPEKNQVTTSGGQKLNYEYLVVALGLSLDYHKIKGLPEAFQTDPGVCSNYHPDYVQKTFPALKNLKKGRAIFTFPNAPIKCAGAPQKIMYLADDYFRRNGNRENVEILYNTSLAVIFGIPRYASALNEIVRERNLNVNFRHNLIEVCPDKKEAIFELLDDPGETKTFRYDVLHVAPPCSAPEVVRNSTLVDSTGFVELNRETLQHTRYPNVFAIGDCTNLPTAKTAAGVAAQCGVLNHTMKSIMAGKQPTREYNGYTSCPLITRKGRTILAEFGYDGAILETFPLNQAKERRLMYHMKKDFMPVLYWVALVKGMWHGPGLFRNLFHLGLAHKREGAPNK